MRKFRSANRIAVAALASMLAGGLAWAEEPATKKDAAEVSKESKEGAEKPAAAKDIVDTAVAAGSFGTLVTAVKAAGLVETLKGTGPFTVFAPTDEAFAKIPAEKLKELLKPENKEKLKGILTYHVVSGKVDAAKASKLTSAATVQGKEIKIKAENGTVTINDAKVVKADIEASNGVIHVIDKVLMPE